MTLRPRDILAAANAFREALGGNTEPHDEIMRRVDICMKCPKRRMTRGAKGGISAVLGMLANRNRVPAAIADYQCNVCGCALLLLLPATRKDWHVDSPKEEKERPKTCWMLA